MADARAHDHDHRPGLGHGRRRAETWASTLATATAVPGGGPSSAAASLGQPAGAAAERQDRPRHLLVDDVLEPRVERGEVGAVGEPIPLRPHRLVAGGAAVARLDAGELPDDPVGGLDQPVGAGVDLGRLVQDLERLGEEPLGRDLAAVAREPRLAARRRHRRDAFGLRLRRVVLPELHPRVRLARATPRAGTAACRRPSWAASCRR